MKTNRIKLFTYLFTSIALITYFVLTGWDNLFAAVLSFLLILSPLAINAVIAFFAKTNASQIILLCTAIAYTAWAFLLLMDARSSSDGQAGLTLLLTAIAASPVLLIAWITCLVIEIVKRKKGLGHQGLPITQPQ
jgi:hypothetical protein